MILEITEEDISNGQQLKCGKCPVALAIKRLFPESKKVLVDQIEIEIDNNIYETPEPIALFMTRFDNYLPVTPFKTNLELNKKDY